MKGDTQAAVLNYMLLHKGLEFLAAETCPVVRNNHFSYVCQRLRKLSMLIAEDLHLQRNVKPF